MKNCDHEGSLIFYVSKFVPDRFDNMNKYSQVYAFGRVFSDSITAGIKVRIIGEN